MRVNVHASGRMVTESAEPVVKLHVPSRKRGSAGNGQKMVGGSMEHGELTSSILGAAIEVHKSLGAGYLESVYANSLDIALRERGISFAREHEIELRFHDKLVGHHRIDLLVEDKVVVELKAVEGLAPVHFAQLRSYLISTQLRVGLLLNFNAPVLEVKRVVQTPPNAASGVFRVPALP